MHSKGRPTPGRQPFPYRAERPTRTRSASAWCRRPRGPRCRARRVGRPDRCHGAWPRALRPRRPDRGDDSSVPLGWAPPGVVAGADFLAAQPTPHPQRSVPSRRPGARPPPTGSVPMCRRPRSPSGRVLGKGNSPALVLPASPSPGEELAPTTRSGSLEAFQPTMGHTHPVAPSGREHTGRHDTPRHNGRHTHGPTPGAPHQTWAHWVAHTPARRTPGGESPRRRAAPDRVPRGTGCPVTRGSHHRYGVGFGLVVPGPDPVPGRLPASRLPMAPLSVPRGTRGPLRGQHRSDPFGAQRTGWSSPP